MDVLQKTIEKDGVTYVFRMPNGLDMIQIDLKARELRQGISDGLGVAFGYSQNVAMLNQLCEQPKGTDFAKVRFDILDFLAEEVSNWLNSFRQPVGSEQGAVGTGQE